MAMCVDDMGNRVKSRFKITSWEKGERQEEMFTNIEKDF